MLSRTRRIRWTRKISKQRLLPSMIRRSKKSPLLQDLLHSVLRSLVIDSRFLSSHSDMIHCFGPEGGILSCSFNPHGFLTTAPALLLTAGKSSSSNCCPTHIYLSYPFARAHCTCTSFVYLAVPIQNDILLAFRDNKHT